MGEGEDSESVLKEQHGPGGEGAGQGSGRARKTVGLGRHEHGVDREPRGDLRGHVEADDPFMGPRDPQPAGLNGRDVVGPGGQMDREAPLLEQGPEEAPNGPGAHDQDLHGGSNVTRDDASGR